MGYKLLRVIITLLFNAIVLCNLVVTALRRGKYA
jgi:hypothetical protein